MAVNLGDEGLNYVIQRKFPEKGYNSNLPHHVLGLQSNAADVQCNIYCDGLILKHSDNTPLKFSFKTSPIGSYIQLELVLHPILPKATAADHELNAREKVRVAFMTYEDHSYKQEANLGRKRYAYKDNNNNTQPPGPLNFSDQIHELCYTAGDGKAVPKAALHEAKYKSSDQLHFSWKAQSCVMFSFGIASTNIGPAKKVAVRTLEKILDHMTTNTKALHVLTRPSSTIKGIFYPWFAAMPSPVLPSFWPWLKYLDAAEPSAIIEMDSRGNPTLDKNYVDRALAVRPKGWIAEAVKGKIDFDSLPSDHRIGTIAAVTQFRERREYLAHVLVGYLLEEAFYRRQLDTFADGVHSCIIFPERLAAGQPRYIMLINVRMPAKTYSRGHEDRSVLEVGERVTVQMSVNNTKQTWTGTVGPMRANLAHQYAVNVLIVATPDLLTPITGRIASNYEGEASFTFGHKGTSTAPTIERLTNLMFEGNAEFDFWRKVLLAQDNISMSAQHNGSMPTLPFGASDEVRKVCKQRGLNTAQTNVVLNYFSHKLTIVRGPPGTGKSTLIDTIVQLEHNFQTKLWVCAESNATVDVLAEKACSRMSALHSAGYLRVRQTFEELLDIHDGTKTKQATTQKLALPASIGGSAGQDIEQQIHDVFYRVAQAAKTMSLDSMIKDQMQRNTGRELYPGMHRDLKALKETIDPIATLMCEPDDLKQYKIDHQMLEKEMISQLRKVQQEFVALTRVVFSTVSAASSTLLCKLEPKALIMDEASQILEAKAVSAIMHALRAGRLERVLLIGDEQQSPPTVSAGGNPFLLTLQSSLFERLIRSQFACIDLS